MANFIFFAKGKPETRHNVSRFPEDVRLEKDDGTIYEVCAGSHNTNSEEYLFVFEKGIEMPTKERVFEVARQLGIPPIIRHIG